LRERPEDIAELAEHFMRRHSAPGRALQLAPEFLDRLAAHTWPGNVRELENCLRRAVALATSSQIGVAALEDCAWNPAAAAASSSDNRLRAGVSLGDMERKLFALTLESTGGNRSRAAALLGVSLRTVRNKIRSYGLPRWSSYVHD
jgi:DNA-binding NtrC family response regulator